MPILIQYAYDDGEIILWNIWKEDIQDTMDLITEFCNHDEGICGFNLAFDWFHLCKVYTIWRLLDASILPMHQINEVAAKEKEARMGPCLKPKAAMDLMLHARKGPYQSTMNRGNITIKRVPSALAPKLVDYLDAVIPLKDIYFARKKNIKQRWQTQEIVTDLDDVDPNFKNVVLRFAPSAALKALAVDALGIPEDKILKFININPPSFGNVTELGYAPFAEANGDPSDWNKSWPFWAWEDIHFWDTNERARKYAEDDVTYTRDLYYHFRCPPSNDVDSILSCMVATVRWHGYAIDIGRIEGLKRDAQATIDGTPFNVNSAAVCKKYMKQVMTDMEYGVMAIDGKTTTKKVVMEEVSKWTTGGICEECEGMGCDNCIDGNIESDEYHPAALRAQEILTVRSAHKEVELYAKLIKAGRFHASFKVIGALSSRMSGADGLNAQGIKRSNYVRSCFNLADPDMTLCGGDFDAFEMSIMDAVYHDPKMHAELISDKKIHGLWGQRYFFPTKTYDEILLSKETAKTPWEDFYGRSKQGVFAVCYFGEGHTLMTRVGLPENTANDAYDSILNDYTTFAEKRNDVTDMFCSMKQEGGIGSAVTWAEPADYIESLIGFKRYFTLENQICKALFELAEKPPKEWSAVNIKVTRRDRVQTASGACRSALFAAAFSVQSSNMRAAGNHRIQSTGADITKELEAVIWEFQPAGIFKWHVQPMNVHDEVMVPMLPELVEPVEERVRAFVEKTKSIIPLVGVDWMKNISDWSGKGGSHSGEEDGSDNADKGGDANQEQRDEDLREIMS